MANKIAALIALALGAAVAPAVKADEINLLFGTTLPAQVHLNMRVLHPWAEKINEQGKGIVHIDVRDGESIANLSNFYSRVQDDVIQISWGLQTAIGGKFPRTSVAGLPFEVEKAEIGSVALWRLYKSGMLDAEYDTVQPLYVITFPPSGVHYAKQPRTLENLKGLKIATGSKVTADAIDRLGGTPLSMVTSEYYTAVQRGMVDAVLVQWTAFQPFKLQDVTFYHLETKLGGAAGMVFMAKKKYDALPAAVKKILDDNSGEAESRVYGKFWDDVDNEGRDMVKALGDKHQIVQQTPEMAAQWRKAVEPVIGDWVKSTPDGEKVLAAFRDQSAKVKAGK
ncbi:MAG TPA: TRAP transporter substrate-binding protein [Stellaceae bacterium]|jgi:TRAP-type C4-dicarboxylate transport system substrate-binding protein|nr:TRAP transporter substrate-binding protein [Stellaceae bacterium]